MHSAHSNIKCDIMNKYLANFYLCGGCSHRERRKGLKDGEYFCAIAKTFLPNGIVTNDTDSTDCVRNHWYNPV